MNIILAFFRDFLRKTVIAIGILLSIALFMFIGAMIGGVIGTYVGLVTGACFVVTALEYLL